MSIRPVDFGNDFCRSVLQIASLYRPGIRKGTAAMNSWLIHCWRCGEMADA
jgi:hypothetical protein